ncbi:unnamed protein product [Rotaria sordida]|uniref:Helicase ATP-binding domain-containing protein n=1 Tax=Rotaria sordida TaxID=392033 RepID=A0A815QTR7_9BILA|nr:unnamed protein product [Rotaria sordida]
MVKYVQKLDSDDLSVLKDQFKIDNDDELSDEELIIKDDNRKILFDDINSSAQVDSTGSREKKAHSDVQDIEDVVKLARELNTCPYYATRAAIAVAHLVVLPYQILMHKSRREAYGIEMRNNVIIIDEAHNLPDAICAMHSNEINGNQVC